MTDGAFHDPTLTPETRPVLGAAAGDHRDDPAGAEMAAVLVVVIAAVRQDPVGLGARAADLPRDRSGTACVDQRQQLGNVVTVPGTDADRQRDAVAVGQGVGLDAILRAIDRGRACEVPPKTARWEDPSTTPVLQSIPPWAFNSLSSRS